MNRPIILTLSVCVFVIAAVAQSQDTPAAKDAGQASTPSAAPAAAAGKEGPVFDLGQVVVTPTMKQKVLKDTPGHVSVITRKQLQSQANIEGDVGKPLDLETGVRIQRYGGLGSATQIRIRGTLSTHSLVLVDGRPVNGPSLGLGDLSWLSADEIERIEVVRGPMSALYGGHAVGGVVNIITRRPPKEMTTKATTSYGTDGTAINSFSHGGTIERLGYLIQGTWRTTGGVRRGQFRNDEATHQGARAVLTYELTEGLSLVGEVSYQKTRVELPGARPTAQRDKWGDPSFLWGAPNPRVSDDWNSSGFDHDEATRWAYSLSLEAESWKVKGWRNEWTQSSWQQSVTTYNPGAVPFVPAPSVEADQFRDSRYKTDMYGIDGHYTFEPILRNEFTVGGGVKREKFDVHAMSYNVPSTPVAVFPGWNQNTDLDAWQVTANWADTRDTWSGFVQDEIDLDPVTLTLGARRDMPNDYHHRWTWRTTGLWDVTDATRVRAGYGQAYRPPTLNDINWPEDDFAQGNQGLQPELSWSWEVGVEQEVGDVWLTRLTYWQQKIKDMIVWAPTGPVGPWGPKWQPDNLNTAKIHGLEWGNKIRIWDGMSASVGVTYLLKREQKNEEIVDGATNASEIRTRTLLNTPLYTVDLGYEWQDMFGVKGLRLNLDGTFVGEREMYYSFSDPWPRQRYVKKELSAYFVLNARVAQTIELDKVDLTIFAAATNLTDTDYSTQFGSSFYDRDYPAQGQSLLFGVSAEF